MPDLTTPQTPPNLTTNASDVTGSGDNWSNPVTGISIVNGKVVFNPTSIANANGSVANTTSSPSTITSGPARTQTTQNINTLNGMVNASPTPAQGSMSPAAPSQPSPVPTAPPAPQGTGQKMVAVLPSGQTYFGTVGADGRFMPDVPPQQGTSDFNDISNENYTVRAPQGNESLQNQMMTAYDTQLSNATTLLRSQMTANNQQLNDALLSIDRSFGARKQAQDLLNQAAMGSQSMTEARTGRARYAPDVSQGILSATENQGIQALGALDAEMNKSINDARMAVQQENFKLLDEMMNKTEAIQQSKNDLVFKLAEEARKQTQAKQEEAQNALKLKADTMEYNMKVAQSSREGAILGLIQQGVTDPMKLFDYVNYDEQGNKIGDITMGEISAVLSGLNAAQKDPATYQIIGDVGKGIYQIKRAPDGTTSMTQLLAPQETDTNKTTNVAPGGYMVDEKGNVIFHAPERPEDIKPTIVKINGKDYQVDAQGNLTEPEVPTEPSDKAVEKAQDALSVIDKIQNDPHFSRYVGASFERSLPDYFKEHGFEPGRVSFEAQVDRLKSLLAVDNIQYLKGQGQISDAERKLIGEIGTSLKPDMSESAFKTELERVKKVLGKVQNTEGSVPTSFKPGPYPSWEALLQSNPDWKDFAKQFATKHPEITDPRDQLQALQIAIEAASKGGGFNGVGGDTNGAKKSSMRTDRNNNPTAMTTDVARTLGLVEGKDYVQGDKFPDSNLHTAKLLGDPIAVTIKGIDKGGFYTASGKQRWTHTAMPKSQWDKLAYNDKVNVVKKMYQHEGGRALASLFENIG